MKGGGGVGMREERNLGSEWGVFSRGKRRTAGREAEGEDELMNNHHMVP